MRIANFVALSAIGFTSGLSFAFDKSGVRSKLLHRFEALNIADFVKDGQREYATNAGDCF